MAPRQRRVEHRPLYDSALIATAANPNPQFYFAPLQGANRYQTSLQTPGRLSGQNNFAVQAIRMIPEPVDDEDTPADWVQILQSVFTLQANGTTYAQFHTFDLPGGAGIYVYSEQGGETVAGNLVPTTTIANGMPHISNRRVLAAPFGLEPSEEFHGEQLFNAVPAMQTARRCFCQLDGQEGKPR